ncbi:MAG: SulP family inorganic anion transporter [Betaproteobacteria bacterium]
MATNKQRWGYGLPDQAYEPGAPATTPAPGAWRHRFRHLRGDFSGGMVAAMLSIPVSIGYGLLALLPLGESAVPHAILAGLYAPVFGCLVAILLGANTTMIYSPRSVTTFLIGSFVLHDLALSQAPYIRSADPAVLLTLAFLLIFLTGVFQGLFGYFKLGTLLKYIPTPVIAGFQNAAAFLLIASQLNTMLGLPSSTPLASLPTHLPLLQPFTILVGVLTCALIMRGARMTRKVPPTILGLLGGAAAYYLIAFAGSGAALGPVVGKIDVGFPDPHYLMAFTDLLSKPEFLEFLPIVVLGALSVATIASLDAVLCARLVAADSGQRFDGNRELVRLGIGNMVTAGFGGIANGINLASSFANHRSGGRTALSVLVHAVAILLAVQLLSGLIAYVPRVVISAALVVVGINLFDRWTLKIARRVFSGEVGLLSRTSLDFIVIVLVATVAIAMNLFFAVALGVAITVVFFLVRMSRSVIRRAYHCDAVHSRKTRAPESMDILARHGGRILVLELEGPLFFGTAEKLATHVEDALEEQVKYVIIDLNRVNEVDSTGAQIIVQLHDRITKQGKYLLMSSVNEDTRLARFFGDMGVTAALTRARMFSDLDHAVEWAEDHLLMSELGDAGERDEFPFEKLDVFAGMNAGELADASAMLTRQAYRKGEVVFRQGDTSRELYIIAKGSASARLKIPGSARETRLITFAAGTVFGEIALLDREARSATIEADEELVCYVLHHDAFEALARKHPQAAIKILSNLGRELGARLRRANRTIQQLAS